ncbi:MAG: isoprenyl transferase [Hyphomonadaceae bacterium]
MSDPAPLTTVPQTDVQAEALPRHIAIIMDGNGRWAKARGMPRAAGHERGVEALRRTVEAAGKLGIEFLTLFSFSTENWRRPADEINALFGLLRAYVKRDLARLKAEGVRVRIIGSRENVPADILDLMDKAERDTAENQDGNLTIAFNYGGREEITRAAKRLAIDVASGKLTPEDIDPERFASALDSSVLPDPDLLIRTSGEARVSNFLLWQIAYAELVILDVLWPDFDGEHLKGAIAEFQKRDRRFGALAGDAQ